MKLTGTFGLIAAVLALPVLAQSARFPPIPADALTEQQKAFERALAAGPRAGTINSAPFKVYVRSPEFALHAIGMSNYLRWGTGLDPRLSELAILLAARHWTSDYVWHTHYPLAIRAGLDPATAAAIAAGRRPGAMRADEAVLYDFLAQIYRDGAIADETFDAAVRRFGEKGITDIIGLASYYGLTAMAVVAAGQRTPAGPEPRLERVAEPFPK